jgi:hypothetical protein
MRSELRVLAVPVLCSGLEPIVWPKGAVRNHPIRGHRTSCRNNARRLQALDSSTQRFYHILVIRASFFSNGMRHEPEELRREVGKGKELAGP